jgi:SAP domain
MISLKQQCAEWGLPKTGNKEDLITRLNGPRPPKVFMQRKAAKQ